MFSNKLSENTILHIYLNTTLVMMLATLSVCSLALTSPPAPTHLQVEGHLVEGGIMVEVWDGVEIWDGVEVEMRQG